MMLGFLLARAGVEILVLEKHADFLRDFRGDTIHPSTLELMHELGLLEEFLKRPHQEVRELRGQVGSETFTLADFSHLPTHCRFVAFMPQWEFLNFLVEQGRRYPGFHVEMQVEATGLIEESGRVAGVRVTTPHGTREIRTNLIVGADGRHSVIREGASLPVVNLGAPMDVMWMRLSRRSSDPGQTFGYIDRGRILVLLNREDYWQCAFVIHKGTSEEIRRRGLPSFREEVARLVPFLRDRVDELCDWKDISLLTVKVDRLTRWSRPGLLCIGDAAHAMSPIGGVGINLAVQDAVAAANILGPAFLRGTPGEHDLRAVQKRRMFPTRATQGLQLIVQNNIIRRVLGSTKPLTLPWFFKLFQRFAYLRRIPARLVGIGFRPEHIRLPEQNPYR
jgi:2-polyprenyl-6-methoxyphenol hydroxylase-like FAD-dependent oxidoreductase